MKVIFAQNLRTN